MYAAKKRPSIRTISSDIKSTSSLLSFSMLWVFPVAPVIAPFDFGDEPSNAGETVTAACTVLKGDHPIDIQWALNGQPITKKQPDIRVVDGGKRVSLLTIDGVAARHAGEYACTASNAAGGTSYSSALAVNGTSALDENTQSFLCRFCQETSLPINHEMIRSNPYFKLHIF